ncbi:MAG: PKD domain-containing protein, partial [Prevotellaceae bacterium]|nr:PKD domain-containing protein [Prevotellaceae bacterium]
MKQLYFYIILFLFVFEGLFAQNNIVGYEYWLDGAYADKQSLQVSPVENFQWQATIPYSDLANGLHVFNTRFKDKNGYWSSTVSSYFYKMPTVGGDNSIIEYEYWLDDTYSAAVKESVTASSVLQLSQLMDFGKLSNGLHQLNIRFRDKSGQWSSTLSRYFHKLPDLSQNKIIAYEYWLNGDYENKVSTAVQTPQTFIVLDSIDASRVTEPKNSISLRFKDEAGQWSSVVTSDFYRPAEAGFTYIAGLSDVAFTNTSRFADTCEWDFGDGKTGHQINPKHTYEPGVYRVKLTVENGNNIDSAIHYVEIKGIRTLSSNRGGNAGIATVTFYGGGLTGNTQVILTNGGNQISGENVRLLTNGELEVEFNLIG